MSSAHTPSVETTQPPATPSAESPDSAKSHHRLTDVDVDNEITALNLIVQFLGLAQKRGAFTIDEAAKIWECVKKFQKPVDAAAPPPSTSTSPSI